MSDYIKREDAIKAVKIALCKKSALTRINNIPLADVRENVRGEWIEVDVENAPIAYACSVCRAGIDYRGFANYCPNCGADMRGEQNDN